MDDANTAYAAALDAIRESRLRGDAALSLSAPAFSALQALPPDVSELTYLQELSLDSTKVADLAPLQALTGLQTLSLNFTQVADLDPLRAFTSLQTLSLDGTQVADLAPLQSLSRLQTLRLTRTQVADLDPLRTLTGLQTLSLDRTQVADLAPLRALIGLQTLWLDGTQVADLAPLQALIGLQMLSLNRTQVADLDPLRTLTGLQTLWLAGTQVADLAPLRALTGLQTLWLDGALVADLAPLGSLGDLRELRLENTRRLSDLRPISETRSLVKEADVSPFSRGLFYRGCAACDLDPDGLGKLAEIRDTKERTEKTLAYLRDLTVWPPRRPDDIRRAIEGPILEASIADIALIDNLYEAVSPDPPLPRERGQDYRDLTQVLAHAAGQIAAPNRVDQFGRALIEDFQSYRLEILLDQPNGRLLDYTVDSIRGALSDDYLSEGLDGRDRARMSSFVRNHDAFIAGWFPHIRHIITLEPDLPAKELTEKLPDKIARGDVVVQLGINLGVFSASVEGPLGAIRDHMESARQTLSLSDDPARRAVALSALRRSATLATAYLGRIKGRLLLFVQDRTELARADPARTAQDTTLSLAAVQRVLAALGPVFDDLWRWIGNLPLPF